MSEKTQKERPILFQGEMVRAILAGTKTQTRRIVKQQPSGGKVFPPDHDGFWYFRDAYYACEANDIGLYVKCPYGAPGDLLYVKEAFCNLYCLCGDCNACRNSGPSQADRKIWYRAEGEPCVGAGLRGAWKSPIFMPRWASRLTIKIVSMRVEKVQEISEDDAWAEGFLTAAPSEAQIDHYENGDAVAWYARLWESINGKKPGCSWAENPWVWAVEFEKVETK